MLEFVTLAAEIDKSITGVIAIGLTFGTVMVGIIAGTISSVRRSRHREESRREIAAYVAEGSISAEDGAKLLSAGKKRSDGVCS